MSHQVMHACQIDNTVIDWPCLEQAYAVPVNHVAPSNACQTMRLSNGRVWNRRMPSRLTATHQEMHVRQIENTVIDWTRLEQAYDVPVNQFCVSPGAILSGRSAPGRQGARVWVLLLLLFFVVSIFTGHHFTDRCMRGTRHRDI